MSPLSCDRNKNKRRRARQKSSARPFVSQRDVLSLAQTENKNSENCKKWVSLEFLLCLLLQIALLTLLCKKEAAKINMALECHWKRFCNISNCERLFCGCVRFLLMNQRKNSSAVCLQRRRDGCHSALNFDYSIPSSERFACFCLVKFCLFECCKYSKINKSNKWN